MAQKTTANGDVAAIDPGGTKSAKGNKAAAGKKSEPVQKVASGDRNTMPVRKK